MVAAAAFNTNTKYNTIFFLRAHIVLFEASASPLIETADQLESERASLNTLLFPSKAAKYASHAIDR